MAVKFAAWGNHQFVIPTTGAPASGYKLKTYVAGSSTPVTTYTTSAGTVAQSNPIVLNSAGFPTTGQIWITEGTSIKIDFTDASDVSIKVEDNIPGTNDATLTQDQWVSGPTPTYVSATSFTVVGDQTSDFHVGRRLKTTNTGGTIYSRISATAYTTLTTVTVVNDSGTLDSGLSAVSYGLLTATSFSIPRLTEANKRILDLPGLSDANTFTGNQINSGTVTMSGKSMYWAKGADIVSAATLPIGTNGNMFDVTGNTGPITAITVPEGMLFMLQFDSTPTLTHHATNLNLPGGANITAVAGMRAICFATAANQVLVLNIIYADGREQAPSIQAEVATTSGTAVTIASAVPAWVKSFAIGMADVSTNGTSVIIVQLGDSGGYETTGYTGANFSDGGVTQLTSGFILMPAAYATAADAINGMLIFTRQDSATQKWCCHGGTGRSAGTAGCSVSGYKTLSDVLTQIRITTANGTDTFDSGAVSITYLG